MKKRIFIGIPASEEIKQKAGLFHQAHLDLPVRWIKPRNLHITLVPPWAIDSAQDLEQIINSLKGSSAVEPFRVSFNRIEFGPNNKNPRLIWASGAATKEILDLRLKIYDCLKQTPDSRLFRLHMTLARVPSAGSDIGEWTRTIREGNIDWTMKVDRFVLYESHLSPEGAEYEVVSEFKLG